MGMEHSWITQDREKPLPSATLPIPFLLYTVLGWKSVIRDGRPAPCHIQNNDLFQMCVWKYIIDILTDLCNILFCNIQLIPNNGHEMDSKETRVHFPAWKSDCSVVQNFHVGSRDHKASYLVSTGRLPLYENRPQCEANWVPPFSVEIRMCGYMPPFPTRLHNAHKKTVLLLLTWKN